MGPANILNALLALMIIYIPYQQHFPILIDFKGLNLIVSHRSNGQVGVFSALRIFFQQAVHAIEPQVEVRPLDLLPDQFRGGPGIEDQR